MDVIRRSRSRSDIAASGDHRARGVLFLSSMWLSERAERCSGAMKSDVDR